LRIRSNILKLSLFATGLSGIVAEYILSTLATYFLGNSVLQWTMIVSIMLFSMGLGSRLSKYFEENLLQKFISIEFTLSILTALVSVFTYFIASISLYTGIVIYSMSVIIGILIGMEIPLVVRLNDEFEILKINISSVLEKDYYGSLAGGIFFAFFGLPFLGLTYTPFVLGIVNFAVAVLLVGILWKKLEHRVKRRLGTGAASVLLIWVAGLVLAKPIVDLGEEVRYKDRVIYAEQSKYQKIVITQYKGDFWLYINGNQQLSTVDEVMYHEPLVLPVMSLHPYPEDILILGGGDGCAAREVLKYSSVDKITLVDLDPAMTNLASEHPVLLELNKGSLLDPEVEVINQDAYSWLENAQGYYDVIIIDLPDPKTIELGRLYSFEFYKLCERHLRPTGLLVTQAGSPYYASRAFRCIRKSIEEAGFQTVPLHNQVITLGEWGWIIGAKELSAASLKRSLQNLEFSNIETRWLNHEAMTLMTSFGKDVFEKGDVEINTIHNPVLFKYYMKGAWDLY
jgi:spermidine synthase